MEFIVAGDSHMFAMGASQSYAGPISLVPIRNSVCPGSFLMDEWKGDRGFAYWTSLVSHCRDRVVVLLVMGNTHFGNFLLQKPPLFDLFDPSDTNYDVYPGAFLVSRRLVKALPAFNVDPIRALIGQLRNAGCAAIVICGTPPVQRDFGDSTAVRKSAFWIQRASSLGIDISTVAFTPAPVMKRLWGVLQECLSEVAAETGSCFLPAPPAALDSEGYMSLEFRAPPGFTHANELYGRLALGQVISWVTKLPEQI